MIIWLEKNAQVPLIITLFIAIFIFYMSSITFAPNSSSSPSLKPTLYHIIIFFMLTFFLAISILKGKNKHLIIPTILFTVIYAILDELHQFYTPGRSSSITDVILDILGILSASILYLTLLASRKVQPLSRIS